MIKERILRIKGAGNRAAHFDLKGLMLKSTVGPRPAIHK